MRGLLKIEPLELGASFVREKAFKRKPKCFTEFEVIKYHMPREDVNKFETLAYQSCFTTARFKH